MNNLEMVEQKSDNTSGLMTKLSSDLQMHGIKLNPIKLYNLISSPTHKVKDIVNTEFKILEFVTLPMQEFKDTKTGELTECYQTIYFIQYNDTSVHSISSYSSTLLKSFNRIKTMLGLNIVVKIVSETTKVDDEVIQYYNVVPIESGETDER